MKSKTITHRVNTIYTPKESERADAGLFKTEKRTVTLEHDAAIAAEVKQQDAAPEEMLKKILLLMASFIAESQKKKPIDYERMKLASEGQIFAEQILNHLQTKERDPLTLLTPMFNLGPMPFGNYLR